MLRVEVVLEIGFFAENSQSEALGDTFATCGTQGDVDQISSTNVTTTGYLFNIKFLTCILMTTL